MAIYTVKVSGTNLSATWYMEWLGDTYTISDIGGSIQPWEGYAGESYGARKLDDNTFAYISTVNGTVGEFHKRKNKK